MGGSDDSQEAFSVTITSNGDGTYTVTSSDSDDNADDSGSGQDPSQDGSAGGSGGQTASSAKEAAQMAYEMLSEESGEDSQEPADAGDADTSGMSSGDQPMTAQQGKKAWAQMAMSRAKQKAMG